MWFDRGGLEPAAALGDDGLEVGEETVQNLGALRWPAERKPGPSLGPRRDLGQGWPVPIRRTPRFWTVSLRETDEPVSQIALACGFASHSHLSTWFRRLVGATPSTYRDAAR